ncbi:MAG: hypothetical protein ACRC0X_04125 [Brevinema sp.]
MAEPLLDITVNGNLISALVDTGATYSTVISGNITKGDLSTKTVGVMGYSGATEFWPMTKPLPVAIAHQSLKHTFLFSSNAPVPLLGRDLLIKVGASILCTSDGVIVSFPSGQRVNCSLEGHTEGNQWLLAPLPTPTDCADIYWVELGDPTSDSSLNLFQQWKTWIYGLDVFTLPLDPPHCTLFYDRNDNHMYQVAFQQIEGHNWSLVGEGLLVGKEGVVTMIKRSTDQCHWYEMSDLAAPHISLALHPKHEARELGSMTKRLL